MSADDQWIQTRIAAARTRHPSVTEAVASQMAGALAGCLSDQPLSRAEFQKMAIELIADMVPEPLETGSKR